MSASIMAWLAALQEPAAAAGNASKLDLSEIILHHMANSHEFETPWKTYALPQWPPVHLGPLTIDFSLSKHVVFLMIAAVLVLGVMLVTAWRMRRLGPGAPKGFASVFEAMTLFVRDEIVMKNIGRGGQPYVPFITTLFFFILFANLLGLLPWGSTPTSNISVTGALAVLSFIAIEISGFLTLGPKKYMRTIFYAPPGMGPIGTSLMMVIMTPVEFLGKLAKPFALAIRLFANMTAGHLVILAFIGLILLALPMGAGSLVIIPGPIIMAVSIMVLEILVALIQAYIFAMLTAVFIGLIRHAH
jgi:F-type H+-transporting ATPase subunit a